MRDILVHNYFGIDFTAVWETIQSDLIELKMQIKSLLDNQ